MKKLIVVRHAKSSWEGNVSDHERLLNKRGLSDAKLVSKAFLRANYMPEKMIISDAKRAKKTAKIFQKALHIEDENFHLNPNLYDFSGEQLINTIKTCDFDVEKLMIFGHNHALTAFVNLYGSQYIDNVPTCGLVVIKFDINHWKDLNKGITELILFPRDLK